MLINLKCNYLHRNPEITYKQKVQESCWTYSEYFKDYSFFPGMIIKKGNRKEKSYLQSEQKSIKGPLGKSNKRRANYFGKEYKTHEEH